MKPTRPINIHRRGVYLLPNLLTTAGLLAGFYGIVASIDHQFAHAALAIFISLIFDGLDGRIARMIKAQSAFGAEYDSLADMLSFGVGPAVLVFNWVVNELSLHSWHKLSWLSAFIYLACVALRLARFNSIEVPDHGIAKRYFFGLPSPAAAAMIASMVWLGQLYQIQGAFTAIIILIVTLLLAFLMVSNVWYRSFKDVEPKEHSSFIIAVIAMVVLVLILFKPAHMVFALMLLYVLSGPVSALLRFNKRLRAKQE